jgi:adenosylcobyric acid synthase
MKQNTLMIQGTTSDAGKSVLVAAFCRIFARHGEKVAPFKSQNMALNSAVTDCGGEIGRAQAVQAQAAKVTPTVHMNPVLLKPNSDIGAQVIVRGKSVGNMKADVYHNYKPQLLAEVCQSFKTLQESFDVIFIEGAGSPAEINLRDRDIANMGLAEALDVPVIIVADIDRGGVFAHLVGTYELLSESEKQRVVGFVINRFRGDVSLLQPGIDWLEERLGVPVIAVVPYIEKLYIEAEDAIDHQAIQTDDAQIKVRILAYPRMSNHTDFDALRVHPQVDCQFVRSFREMTGADLIILPGSKSVRDDLAWLKRNGLDAEIKKHLRYGGKVLGICGGYQMLGEVISDPFGIESTPGDSEGLELLPLKTVLAKEKTLVNVSGVFLEKQCEVKGYEIHAGKSEATQLGIEPLFRLVDSGSKAAYDDGLKDRYDNVRGTYLHGLFDESAVLNAFLEWAGLSVVKPFDFIAFQEREMDRLADVVEAAMPYEKICRLMDDFRDSK